MTTYPETTLSEFQTCLDIEKRGGKSGITICYRGLLPSDKHQARWLLRDTEKQYREWSRTAAMHLRTVQAKQHRAVADRMYELQERFRRV